MKNTMDNSGDQAVEIIRINVTMPKKLHTAGRQKAISRCFPSFSAYIQEFIRSDCGLVVSATQK